MSARGYGILTPSTGGRCHGVKIQRRNGLNVFYGGADDLRWDTAKVDVLCDGDGSIPDPKPFCQNVMVNALIKAAAEGGDDVNRLSIFGVCVCLILSLLF